MESNAGELDVDCFHFPASYADISQHSWPYNKAVTGSLLSDDSPRLHASILFDIEGYVFCPGRGTKKQAYALPRTLV